jgi:hypothetical protein
MPDAFFFDVKTRDLIIALAASYAVPTIYFNTLFAESGGLIAYSADFAEELRQSAGYIERTDDQPQDREIARPRHSAHAACTRGRGDRMRRRDLITMVGGAAATWALAARAQSDDRMRHVGVLMAFNENDPRARVWLSRFIQGLTELGWADGNLLMDVRWAGDGWGFSCRSRPESIGRQ